MSGETEKAGGAGEVLFQVKDLHVTYCRPGQKAVEAVRGVSFDLHAGETLGIVGESGSGKSTIAKTLLLIQPSSGGMALFRGKNIAAFTTAERRQYRRDVQMVFQDAVGSLNPRMTIRQALEEVRARQPEPGSGAEDLLDRVGLSKAVLDQYPRELSGGQCQRASFARALAVNPKVLVADEPVSALDVSVQARILNLMRDLRRELGLGAGPCDPADRARPFGGAQRVRPRVRDAPGALRGRGTGGGRVRPSAVGLHEEPPRGGAGRAPVARG